AAVNATSEVPKPSGRITKTYSATAEAASIRKDSPNSAQRTHARRRLRRGRLAPSRSGAFGSARTTSYPYGSGAPSRPLPAAWGAGPAGPPAAPAPAAPASPPAGPPGPGPSPARRRASGLGHGSSGPRVRVQPTGVGQQDRDRLGAPDDGQEVRVPR